MDQSPEQGTASEAEAPIGPLVLAIALFVITGGAAALYIWWDLDDLLAGKFMPVPTLIALVLIGVFFGLLGLWGKFLKSQSETGARQ